MIDERLKLFKKACKIMTNEQKDKIEGFRAWEKAQAKAYFKNKIFIMLKKKRMSPSQLVILFKKDEQRFVSVCLRDLIRDNIIGVNAKWQCYIHEEYL